ncbi:hypothetical protein XvhCFBP2543_03645 [Xanthomonas vasicola]|nr:hypothetical protein XvhCFBP2543_03645 [Xanthomonas vasicola]
MRTAPATSYAQTETVLLNDTAAYPERALVQQPVAAAITRWRPQGYSFKRVGVMTQNAYRTPSV